MQGKYVLLLLTVSSLFSVIVVGAYVAAAGFGGECGSDIPRDWPGCLNNIFPPPQLGPIAEYSHRILAALSTLLLVVTTALFWKSRNAADPAKRILLGATFLLIVQVLLGGVVVAQQEEPVLVAVHQAIAVLVFGLTVAAYSVIKRPA